MAGTVASVVLATGAATRFGSPKQLAPLAGRPLLEHALAAYAAEIEATVDFGEARVIHCDDWERGRGASLRAGLADLPDDADAALITLGDEPFVPPAAADRLLAARRPEVAALRAGYAGRPGHPVPVERELFGRLAAGAGDRSPGAVLEEAGVEPVPCGDLGMSADVDTPAQLAELAAAQRPAQRTRPSSNSE